MFPRRGLAFIRVSFFNRIANDWYGQVGGDNPVLLQLDVDEPHPTQGGSEDNVAPEGRPDLYAFAGIQGDSALPVGVGIGFSQRFTIFQNNFYYGIPPEDWSFVNGDPMPF